MLSDVKDPGKASGSNTWMNLQHHLLLALLTCCGAIPAQAQIGAAIVRLDGSGPHYLYSARKLTDGDKVYLQYPKNGRPTCCAHIDWRTARPASSDPDAMDLGTSRPLYRYRFMSRSIKAALPFIGLAAVGRNATVTAAGAWRIEALAGKAATDFTLCVTPDGVRVESQAAGQAPSRLYLHLGYDLEYPPCPLSR